MFKIKNHETKEIEWCYIHAASQQLKNKLWFLALRKSSIVDAERVNDYISQPKLDWWACRLDTNGWVFLYFINQEDLTWAQMTLWQNTYENGLWNPNHPYWKDSYLRRKWLGIL